MAAGQIFAVTLFDQAVEGIGGHDIQSVILYQAGKQQAAFFGGNLQGGRDGILQDVADDGAQVHIRDGSLLRDINAEGNRDSIFLCLARVIVQQGIESTV